MGDHIHGMVAETVPTSTAKDLLVLKRGATVEVWTLRDFKKHEICFAPVTTNVRDSYWTVGRSVLLEGSTSLHPSKKHLVLDGRARSGMPTPVEADSGAATFSLFWSVERTDNPTDANLELKYPTLEVTAAVLLPGAKKAAAVDAGPAQTLVPPVLINTKPITKHVRLLAIDDLNLQKITKAIADKRKAEPVEGRESKKSRKSE